MDEFVTPMGEGAASMRELFVSLVKADFTKLQACVIVAHVMVASAIHGTGTD